MPSPATPGGTTTSLGATRILNTPSSAHSLKVAAGIIIVNKPGVEQSASPTVDCPRRLSSSPKTSTKAPVVLKSPWKLNVKLAGPMALAATELKLKTRSFATKSERLGSSVKGIKALAVSKGSR